MILTSTASDVIYLILISTVIIVATYFLMRLVIKDAKKNREEKTLLIDGIITKSEMNSIIATYMNRMGEGANFSLIYLDLDKFGDLVMAFGNKEADQILKNVAEKIKRVLPKNTYISKYKGDEFLLFFPQSYDRSDALLYANELLEAFRQPITVLGNKSVDLTASIAISYYPHHGRNIKELLESLNLAIYRIKKEGGNAVRIYSSDLMIEEEHLEYYYQIKKAINDKEFKFHYQPIYYLENKTVYGYEALLRWEHPEHGIISPFKFINLLEQSGDIHWVGIWGFETLVKKHLELRFQSSFKIPKLTINLSPKQLYDNAIVGEYSKTLKRNKVEASNFVLEIGEFALFESQDTILKNIESLQKMGFIIAIDGFGLDIATFEKLKELNINTIKVDYEFIADDTFIVNKHLEILREYTKDQGKIIVQGVENELNLERIKSLNIDVAQGYFLSKPVSEEEIMDINKTNIDLINEI